MHCKKIFKAYEHNSLSVLFMSPVDYHKIVMPFVEEAIGLATLLIPEPKPEPVRVMTDVETAELNTERIKVIKKLLGEVKQDTTCPKCLSHVDAAEKEIEWLEEQVPQYERIARLRKSLRELLDEVKTGLPLLTEEQMKGLEPSKVEGEKVEGSRST